MAAAYVGSSGLVDLLLEHGASVDQVGPLGKNALYAAISGNQSTIIPHLLAKGVDIHHRDFQGYTPLHFAVYWNSPEAVQILLEHGADLDTRDNNGRSVFEVKRYGLPTEQSIHNLLQQYQHNNLQHQTTLFYLIAQILQSELIPTQTPPELIPAPPPELNPST